mmetsp:Transcript_810/g.994  ORF Transcript_810/g.994 Transcript_810/m.994 type:complete len:86 (+) Transcript_810:651-908(+)
MGSFGKVRLAMEKGKGYIVALKKVLNTSTSATLVIDAELTLQREIVAPENLKGNPNDTDFWDNPSRCAYVPDPGAGVRRDPCRYN